ncbi:pre-B-cell leukemia transcription factor-interacting protein 1 isoform X3 [Xiphophorus maculatus]|uniref:pre-B-cell leukemia transcription factor-interacting protein 1 isoform X3 n=1 Tax=Xiphophorus maculatus TaxID=8083 RepID=UPI000C6CDBBC|nr:pre-B-cell leukemia transcription factor-interacting protein 1 isoform X3 [Xiphophorus maculatus]
MSGGGAANNSWTILTSEETVAETLRPLAEGTKQHEESHTSATGPGEKNQPPNSAESAEERLPEEGYLVSEDQNADSNSNPPSVDASGTLDHDGPPDSLLSTETLGGAEFSPAEEELRQEETLHLQNKEEPHQEGQQSGIGERTEEGESVERRRKSLLEQIGRKEEEEEEEVEEEFQVPQRENDGVFSLNKCILAALILLGLGTVFFSGVFMDFDEESDYTTRELKDTEAPGKQEWLSPEVAPGLDHNSPQLLNKLAEGNQQISALQAQLQAQKEELKVAKEQAAEGEEQRLLWEEVEKENSRLKTEIASLPVLQKENDRMKKELESVPVLQKELETLRSTVTNLKLSPATSDADQASMKHSTSPPSDQTEDGRQDSAGPPGKQPWKTWGDQRQKKDPNKVKYEINDKKQQKGKDKSVRKEGDGERGDKMEWKKGKHEHGKLENDKDKPGKKKRQSDEASPWKQKELKKEKGGRGDDGRQLEDKEGRKELKEDRERKKGNFEKVHEQKEWKGKEKDEWRGGKNRNQKLKGEMEWKKGKHGGKEKQERKDWKEKGDKKDPEWKDKIGKEGKGKGERKQWDNSKSQGKERTGTDERKQWNEYERKSKNGKEEKKFRRKDETSEQFKIKEMKLKEKKHNVDWEKDQSHSLKKRNNEHEFPGNHGHKEEHLYGERKPHHTHPKPAVGQPEYWFQQRQRLQHDLKPLQQCDTLETCAQAEGLLPVSLSEFDSVLQTYLTKIEEAGVDGSKTSELRKIALEFFKDGMFVHNQRSFQDFVDDLSDILEDMVEDGDEEDSDLEDEMEGFEKEVLKMFSLPGGREKEKRIKGEWRKENRQERG